MAPSFVRPAVRDMDGYTPGEQPGLGERVVKLNTNENPFPPSPMVLRAIKEVEAEIPWERDYSLPIEGLLAARPQAIYIANPNAPTGTFVSPLKVAELAKAFKGLVLVDEAYVDFADDSCLALVKQHENLVISRTF